MKKKTVIVITVFCALFIMSSTQIKTKEPACKGGIYKTYEDFLNGNLTEAGQFIDWTSPMIGSFTLVFKENGKIVKHIKKDEEFWGFKNDYCLDHCAYADRLFVILVSGKIWMLSYPGSTKIWDTDGNKWDGTKQIASISIPIDESFFYTKDITDAHSLTKYSVNKLIEDDVELYNELKNKKNSDKTPLYIMGLVKRYNELHK